MPKKTDEKGRVRAGILSLLLEVDRAQDSNLALFFRDLSQSENFSEINPPLMKLSAKNDDN